MFAIWFYIKEMVAPEKCLVLLVHCFFAKKLKITETFVSLILQ